MSNPKVRASQKSDRTKPQAILNKDSASTFSEDAIRTRAYQIYESRGSIHNRAEEDWSQAQSELTDLVGGK